MVNFQKGLLEKFDPFLFLPFHYLAVDSITLFCAEMLSTDDLREIDNFNDFKEFFFHSGFNFLFSVNEIIEKIPWVQ